MDTQELSTRETSVSEEGAMQYTALKGILLEHGKTVPPNIISPGGPESDLYTYMFYSTFGRPIDLSRVSMGGTEGIEVRSSTSETFDATPDVVVNDVRNNRRIITVTDTEEGQVKIYTVKADGDIGVFESNIRPNETGEYEYHPSLKQRSRNKMHRLLFRNSPPYRSGVIRDLGELVQRVQSHAETATPQPTA